MAKILGRIFGGGDTIKGTLEGAGTLAKDIRAAITGDNPELDAKIAEFEAQTRQAQIEWGKIEAGSSSWFIAGARPFILWTCGLALFYNYLAWPVLGIWVQNPPAVDINALYPLMLGLLGLGGMRTYEKSKGVQDRH